MPWCQHNLVHLVNMQYVVNVARINLMYTLTTEWMYSADIDPHLLWWCYISQRGQDTSTWEYAKQNITIKIDNLIICSFMLLFGFYIVWCTLLLLVIQRSFVEFYVSCCTLYFIAIYFYALYFFNSFHDKKKQQTYVILFVIEKVKYQNCIFLRTRPAVLNLSIVFFLLGICYKDKTCGSSCE